MTTTQRELARHALGLPNGRNRSFRNRYICDANSDWDEMVAAGLATRSGPLAMYSDGMLYTLTPNGARLALMPGETLDPEDFTQ